MARSHIYFCFISVCAFLIAVSLYPRHADKDSFTLQAVDMKNYDKQSDNGKWEKKTQEYETNHKESVQMVGDNLVGKDESDWTEKTTTTTSEATSTETKTDSMEIKMTDGKISKGMTTTKKPKIIKPKLVLFYTKFYGREFRNSYYSDWKAEDCTYKCVWTDDRSKLNRSDVVMFSIRNWLWNKDLTIHDLPARDNPKQLWAMIIKEPQAFFRSYQLKMLNNKFNLSVTFQRDSDVTIPHGTYVKLSKEEIQAEANISFIEYFKKPKTVSWLVSNCVTSSKRESYADELKKYIDLDIYGGCTGKSPGPGGTEGGRLELAKKYKFYLAFENSDCDDYVTEKFWQYLTLGMIPVVRGKRVNYTLLAPPNSFVHADRFKSVEDLANHLKEAARNETLFNTYHEWRRRYKALYSMFSTNRKWMCDFCEKVFKTKHQLLDMYEHFSPDTRCFIHTASDDPARKDEHIQNLDP